MKTTDVNTAEPHPCLYQVDKPAVKALLSKHFAMETERSKVLVLGLGDTGVSVARYLQFLGFYFAISDSRKNPPASKTFYQQMSNIPIFTGGFDKGAFEVATHLIVSPGIALNEKAVTTAVERGAKVLSDIDLFACSVDAPIIGITGSNGKSTVTTMLGHMAKSAGKKIAVGGNIGTPALDLLSSSAEQPAPAELYVLELSSFQLERASVLNAVAATVLNISPDHLDRHVDIKAYACEKARIFNGDGAMVLNVDDPVVLKMKKAGRRTLTFSIAQKADFYLSAKQGAEYLMHDEQTLMPLAELPLAGRHNAANALAALALGVSAGLNEQAMCAALKKFTGLKHRMQKVAERHGVTWINDSKATNIGACIAALQGSRQKVVLIAGGDAKGADMSELTDAVKAKAKSVILMGKDATLIDQALNDCVPVYYAETMAQAVKIADGLAVSGECVLLSPACASLDQYKNYMERGEKFTQAVLELPS